MRLFVAVGLNEEVKQYLADIQKMFSGVGELKFVKEFHLTLKFLGDVNEKDAEKLKLLLDEIKYQRFELCLDKIGVFPNANSARVLWVGVVGDVKKLQMLVEGKLRQDFGAEERFKEHITLARIKQIRNKDAFKECLKTEIKKMKFLVEDFLLIKSELKMSGHVYTELRRYGLD